MTNSPSGWAAVSQSFSTFMTPRLTVCPHTDCTPKAIQHRISAVRKMTSDTVTSEAKITQSGKKRKAAVKEDGDGEGTGSGEADDTPSKPKKARAPRKKATPKKSKVTVAGGDDGEEEDMKKEEDVMEEEAAAEEIIQEPVMVEDVGIVGGGEA